MDAIDYLIAEHESHRKLLDGIETDHGLFQQFRDEFVHHVNMEEAILYPNLLKVPELEMIVREAWEEHSLCMQLVQEMEGPGISEKAWESKFSVFKKLLLTHLEEEEEKLFPKVRELATRAFLIEVGEQMLLQKELTTPDEILYPEEPDSHKLSPER